MYNTQAMIETGAQALRRNPKRDATAWEFKTIRDNCGGGEWDSMTDAYLFGVAVGMRIAEAERKRQGVKQ